METIHLGGVGLNRIEYVDEYQEYRNEQRHSSRYNLKQVISFETVLLYGADSS